MFANLSRALVEALADVRKLPVDRLVAARHKRLMEYGRFKEEK
jgi:acetyl-CoA carboxylase alpha subunit